jgi:hypothetical protein
MVSHFGNHIESRANIVIFMKKRELQRGTPAAQQKISQSENVKSKKFSGSEVDQSEQSMLGFPLRLFSPECLTRRKI